MRESRINAHQVNSRCRHLPALRSPDLWTRGGCVKATVVLRSQWSDAAQCTSMTVDHATMSALLKGKYHTNRERLVRREY